MSDPTPTRAAEVVRHLRCPAGVLYDAVADVERMSLWSPEVERVRWTGEVRRPQPGARFAGRNRRGRMAWSTRSLVVEATRPERFSFDVFVLGRRSATWSYAFADRGDGTTTVTESWRDHRGPLLARLADVGVPDRRAHALDQMTATLQTLDRRLGAGEVGGDG